MSTYARWKRRLKRRKRNRRRAVQAWQKAHAAWKKARKRSEARKRAHRAMAAAKKRARYLKPRVAEAKRKVVDLRPSTAWDGCRAVTDEVVRIVDGRAPITSRKRTATYGNPGSDHHVSQTNADAVDFGIAEAHWLKNEISRRLGGPSSLPDYGSFTIRRNGGLFRVQIIAGTHGTGPHLHVGVRRVG